MQRGLVQCKLQNLTGQVDQVPDSQDVGSGAALEGESVEADTLAVGGAEAHCTVDMRRRRAT